MSPWSLQKAQKEKQIIHDKVLNYTGKPLGQFSFQELVVSILNPLEKPITINNKSMHSLTSYLNALEKYQDKFLSIKTAIDHLKKIASEKNWEIPDSVAEVLHKTMSHKRSFMTHLFLKTN